MGPSSVILSQEYPNNRQSNNPFANWYKAWIQGDWRDDNKNAQPNEKKLYHSLYEVWQSRGKIDRFRNISGQRTAGED